MTEEQDRLLIGLGRKWYDCLDKLLEGATVQSKTTTRKEFIDIEYWVEVPYDVGKVVVRASQREWISKLWDVLFNHYSSSEYSAKCTITSANGGEEFWNLPAQQVYTALSGKYFMDLREKKGK